MRNQPATIDQELISFRFAAENRMIVDDQTILSFTGQLLKDQRRRQSADSATHDNTIVNLTCLDYVRWKTFRTPGCESDVLPQEPGMVFPLDFA